METGFYYISSRYYDSEVGRWLNADGYITTRQGILSYNMFAYCLNNPVMYTDLTGTCITNTRGDTIHINCRYNPRKMFSVLESVSTSKTIFVTGFQIAVDSGVDHYTRSPKPKYLDKGTFNKNKKTAINKLNKISSRMDSISGTIDNALFGLELSQAITNDLNSGQSGGKSAWDITVDTTILTANNCAAGMVFAVVLAVYTGTYVATAGFVAGAVADWGLSELGTGAREEMKAWRK